MATNSFIVLAVNYCAAITNHEDTVNAMEKYLDNCILSEGLTLDCLYLCCFINNLEYVRGFYGINSDESIHRELDKLKRWHKRIFRLMTTLLDEEFYSISVFLEDIESSYLDFKKLVSDMEFIDPENKQRLAFFYVHNERNYALGVSSQIATKVFQSFHEQRKMFMAKNDIKWALLDEVNRSEGF